MIRKVEFLAIVAVIAGLIGCATDDFPTAPPDGGGGNTVSFNADIQPIFTNSCANSAACHVGGLGGGGLDLRAGTSYMRLVNIMSQFVTDTLVVPGSAARSYLVAKLEGTQSFGSPMPLIGTISGADIQKIKDWIDDGAQDN